MKYGVDSILHTATGKVEYGVVHQSTGRVIVKGDEAAMISKMHQMNGQGQVHPIFQNALAAFRFAA